MNLFNFNRYFFLFFTFIRAPYSLFSVLSEDFILYVGNSRATYATDLCGTVGTAQLATRCRTSRGKIEFPSVTQFRRPFLPETPSLRVRCLVIVPGNLVRAVNKAENK